MLLLTNKFLTMNNAKKIQFILAELKRNELYLNKVFTKNSGLLICSTFDSDTQKQILESKTSEEINAFFVLVAIEKENANFDSRLTNFITNLND